MVLTLSALEGAMMRSKPVHLRRFTQTFAHTQGAEVQAKPKANMPTAKTLFGDMRLRGNDSGSVIDWKCFGVGSQPVVDVPAWLAAFFDAQCYTAEFTGNEGVWYATMFGLDANFVTRTDSDQTRCVLELKQQMAVELDHYYQKHRYRQYGYSKVDMYNILTRSDAYHSSLGHYLSDFLDLNLLVMLKEKRYYWVGKPSDTRVTMMLFNHDITWGSIVHPDLRSHLFADAGFITRRHTHLTDYDIGRMVLTMDDIQITRIRRELRKMKVKELHDKAAELEIDLYDADHKKKLKAVLAAEIFLELTGQSLSVGSSRKKKTQKSGEEDGGDSEDAEGRDNDDAEDGGGHIVDDDDVGGAMLTASSLTALA